MSGKKAHKKKAITLIAERRNRGHDCGPTCRCA